MLSLFLERLQQDNCSFMEDERIIYDDFVGGAMNKILIVDDQACIRQLLTAELILQGYHVAGAGDVESALKRLSFYQPDLVLLDLHLDGLDGFKLVEKIKNEYLLPVIIFTAYDSFRDDPRLSKVDGYILKTMDLGPLKRKIAETLDPANEEEKKTAGRSWRRISKFSPAEAVRTPF